MISGSHMEKLVSHSFMKGILKELKSKEVAPEDLNIYLSVQKIVKDIEQELKSK